MELTRVMVFEKEQFTAKANVKNVEVGKWFRVKTFCGENYSCYGKVVEILEDGFVLVEKYFEVPNRRFNYSPKWYDNLPYAI